MQKRKLIEVALPLEAINREAAREKEPFTRRHPRALHIWWARRPLTAARAVLFAQLVDDPSARPEEFPTEELQRKERERLHQLIERIVVWENSWDVGLMAEAYAEIVKSTDGDPPSIIDPFAGGGSIPLEAQRLGLKSHASDLNPVAVLINKALIEIPPRFKNQEPIFPGLAAAEIRVWSGVEGLQADIRAYGDWLRHETARRIGEIYPNADGRASVAWIWARTVTCPNPGCGIELPLVRSWWLAKKKGKEAYIIPAVVPDLSHPSKKRVTFSIGHGSVGAPTSDENGTVDRTGARCLACQAKVDLKYIRSEGVANRLGQQLMAVVGEGVRSRNYLAPDDFHIHAASIEPPANLPEASIPAQALGFRVQAYGLNHWVDLFTNRQLLVLATFSDLVKETHNRVIADGGTPEYADAIATYLGLAVSRYADLSNTICSWNQTNENVRALFSRQAVPMTWDFAEANALGPIGLGGPIESVCNSLYVGFGPEANAQQVSAQEAEFTGRVISTDPPYYDNIGYSDLSDFFYVWLRRSLGSVHPQLFKTMLVPKAEELVANPYRHNGKDGAKRFFEEGFQKVFARARANASEKFPITVYYAFKQGEADEDGTASTGWETLLDSMIQAGWEITSTWPIRSERSARAVGLGANALASSIILSLRPRPESAAMTDRRGLIVSLEAELPEALRHLQQGLIAPVDLPQAAIGPGMAIFSRYSAVLEPNGSKMTVRSALARINEILDQVLNEQEGDFDTTSRFAIAWYRQHGYSIGKFGDADNLARARNTSVEVMDRDGILSSRAGSVQLIKPAELTWDYDIIADPHVSNWEVLHHLIKLLERDGIASAGDLLQAALGRSDGAVNADLVKEMAHLLFRIAESRGWTKDAMSFNDLVTSWPEILDVARKDKMQSISTQDSFDFNEDD